MFITPWEVIKFSPLDKSFPPDKVSNVLKQTEKNALTKFFGSTFMGILYDDLKVDSNVYVEYTPGTWAANSKVVHNGLRYVSNVSTSKVPGYQNNPDWVLYELFKTSEYNDFWVQYMRDYLAYTICMPAVTFGTFQSNGNGLMRFVDQNTGAVTATQNDFGIWMKEAQNQRDLILSLMTQWLLDTHATYSDPEDSLFKEVSFIKTTLCNNNTVAKRGSGRYQFMDKGKYSTY